MVSSSTVDNTVTVPVSPARLSVVVAFPSTVAPVAEESVPWSVANATGVAGIAPAVEIRIFEADGTSVRVLANMATDPASPYPRFDNNLALSDDSEILAVYVADGVSLRRVVGKGDVVETDLGTGQVGQDDSSPVFSGRPSISADGDVAFVAVPAPRGRRQSEWGSGVFVAYAP